MTFVNTINSTTGTIQRVGNKQSAVEIRDGQYAKLNWSIGTPTIIADAATVTSTAALLADADPNRVALHVHNTSGSTIYLGASDVTTSTGFPVTANARIELPTASAIWAVAASGSLDVRTLAFTV